MPGQRAAPIATSAAGGTAGAARSLPARPPPASLRQRQLPGDMWPRLARVSQVQPDPPAPPQAARRRDVRGSWPRPSPGLWAGRQTPSAHSWLFLVGSGHFPSPPPPAGAGRPEKVGRRGSSRRLRARSRPGLPARPSPGGAGNSCRRVLPQQARLSAGTCAGGGGAGRGGERASGRAGRGGERASAAAAAAAVLIPAAQYTSGRGASQMACPALGLEALQPLQPEPPPEPAFSEAQKWIEVGAGG